MKNAMCGPRGYPSWRARGEGLAETQGWVVLDCRKPIPGKFDTIWVVKRRVGHSLPENLRASCDRLILDPLDYWASPTSADPYRCWRSFWDELPFDDLIATSPASQIVMREGLPETVSVHLLPHQCDPRIRREWYDPDGPIVYAGSRCFVSRVQKVLIEAGRILGREVRLDFRQHHAWRSLEGAALQICLRFPPHNGAWNRLHRPQIKLENSAAAGIPVIYNGHECETSLHPGHVVFDVAASGEVRQLADTFRRAMESPPPQNCYRPETFFEDAGRLVFEGTLADCDSENSFENRWPGAPLSQIQQPM